jgi:YVTN family beta-propeller protein
MFHQTANDTHAPLAGRLHITRALEVTRAFAVTRLKALALFACALGIILTGAQSALAQAPTRLYVADYNNSRVAVFDPKAIEPKQNFEQVEATPFWVPTGAMPFGVIASPDGRRVYTANYASDNVTVIDTTAKPNPVALYNVDAGDGPYQLALSPDARTLYVSDFDGASVTALDLGTSAAKPTTKWTLQLPYSPTGMVVSPNGRYLFVNQYQDWKTLVVDLSPAFPQVVHPIQVGPAPVAIAMSKDGKRLYVANEFDQFIQWGASLSIIDSEDPQNATEVKRIQLAQGASPRGQMSLSGNGRWLFITEGGTASVTTVDLLNNKIEAETRTWPGPLGAALSPDGGLIYSSNEGNAISIVDTGTATNLKDILVPFQPNETPARFECMALVTLPTCP